MTMRITIEIDDTMAASATVVPQADLATAALPTGDAGPAQVADDGTPIVAAIDMTTAGGVDVLPAGTATDAGPPPTYLFD